MIPRIIEGIIWELEELLKQCDGATAVFVKKAIGYLRLAATVANSIHGVKKDSIEDDPIPL